LALNETDIRNLELLLESLIKMVGRAHQNMDSLQKRVSQLEWIMKQHQLEIREQSPVHFYPSHPQKNPDSIPFHL